MYHAGCLVVKNSCAKVPLFRSKKQTGIHGFVFCCISENGLKRKVMNFLAFLWFSKSLVVYSLENSHFDLEAKNGGLVQMGFPFELGDVYVRGH